MMRDTMHMWLQRCSNCGYVAPELAEAPEKVVEVVRSQAYIDFMSETTAPKAVRPFIFRSYLQEQIRSMRESAWAAIHAAWISDDENISDVSDILRLLAVRLMNSAAESGAPLSEDPEICACIRTDLLRRVGRFDDADRCAAEALGKKPSEIVGKFLEFERQLIARKDRVCHTVAEAVDALKA